VGVNIGSHVTETTSIAEIVDNSQLHLDLYVYERDLSKLRVGQTIHFTLTNNPGKEYDADIYGISNTFEDATKAIAVHALVKGSKEGLISGMSVTALVSLDSATVPAVPSEAIVNHEGQDYIFVVVEGEDPAGSGHAHDDGHAHNEGHDHGDHAHAEEHGHGEAHDHAEAHAHGEEHSHEHEEHEHGGHESAAGSMQFQRIPVAKGTSDVGYSEITLLAEIPPHARVVTKGAFFLLAKMTNQGEAHSH
jgi:cobalt-zinc-cadmium efflux system membrane fusion protein